MNGKGLVSLNILFNMGSFVITFLISFFVTPYVTKNVGMEAYGLIGLANNFTSYITIVTSALNSMASRFIVLEINKKNYKEANKYFNSTFIANIISAGLILLICVFLIPNLDKVLNISPALVQDAKSTFLLVFITFSISLTMSVFGIVYYANGKLYIGAGKTIITEIIRAIVIFLIFTLVGVKIQYTVVALLFTTIISSVFDMVYIKKSIPEIGINFKCFEVKKVFEMVKAGIWNSISKLSQVLLNGLDLIITNLFIGGSIQGCVSIAKTFSNIIISLIASVSDVFLPKFLKSYADSEEALDKEFFLSTKILGYFSCLILSLFITYCRDFYIIWLPGEDYILISNLTYISLLSIVISGPVYSMFSIYTVINKVKPQAVANLIMSVLSTGTVFVLLKTTNLGVYAIVGVSSIFGMIKNLTYNMYCLKKYAGINIKKCYTVILRNILTMAIICGILTLIKGKFEISNLWILIIHILFGAVITSIIYIIFNISMADKKKYAYMIKQKVSQK